MIGEGVTVLDGVHICEGAAIAPGSVVTPRKTVGSGEVWAGIPARKVRTLSAAEKEEMPDENEAISVAELYTVLEGLSDGSKLNDYVSVKGYVAANNEGGNMYRMLSIVDNTG